MSDLISKKALIKVIETIEARRGNDNSSLIEQGEVLDLIEETNTIDAVPVVHGDWSDGADIIEARLHRHYFRCKVCHKFADSFIGGTENWWCSEKPNYCPNCGAKMDGGESE